MKRFVIVTVGLMAAGLAQAEIYKCTDAQGKVTFSQTQCAVDAVPVDMNVARPTPEQASITARRVEENQAMIADGIARRRAMDAEATRRQRIENLEQARSAELSSIRAHRARASNNLAGATLEGALAADEANVNARYQVELDRLRGGH